MRLPTTTVERLFEITIASSLTLYGAAGLGVGIVFFAFLSAIAHCLG